MRNIRQLLKVLLVQIEVCNQEVFTGMCCEIEVLAGHHANAENIRTDETSPGEIILLMDYLSENRPKNKRLGDFWWTGKHTYDKQPRINWLKRHINNN